MGRDQDSRGGERGSARGSGRGSLETGTPGGARAAPSGAKASSDRASGEASAGSHRVGYAPQEHAHQRVGRPEHLHLLLHEMLLLGFGGEAETRARRRCRRRYGGRRDRGGRHSIPLPRTRRSGSRSRRRNRLPTPEALLTWAAVT